MAIRETVVPDASKNAPAGPAPSINSTDFTQLGAQAQVDNAPRSGNTTLKGLINLFNSGAGVTPEIELYLKNVKAAMASTLTNVEMIQLAEPQAAHAFLATSPAGEKYAYIIIFTDAIGAQPMMNYPKSRYIAQAYAALRQVFEKAHLLNAVLIGSADLQRSRQLANTIVGTMLPAINPMVSATPISAFATSGEFIIDFNVESARNFESSHSPHDVRPRADLGFTLALADRSRNNNNHRQNGYPGDMGNPPMPTIGVTAFIDVIGPQLDPTTNTQKFYPVVRITSITSQIPLSGVVLLAMATAADYFISKMMWINPYSRFDKNSPNLGNLFPNPESKKANELYSLTNRSDLMGFALQHFFKPTLCVDVQEGHARIPILAEFSNGAAGVQNILQAAQNFFGVAPPNTLAVSAYGSTTFEGHYGDTQGRLLDTRNITYLDQVAKYGSLETATTAALLKYENPASRAEVVSAQAPGFVSMYETMIIALDSQFMNWIAGAMQQANLRIIDPSGAAGYTQTPAAFSSFGNYANFVGVSTPQSGGFGMPSMRMYNS